jgi:uncharacterized protein
MRILVDADACPVKDDILEIAGRLDAQVIYVSNGGLRPSRYPGARLVTVSAGADAADDWIAAEAGPQDIVVTADIPLADRALGRGAAVLNPNGRPFTAATIGAALSFRAFNQHLRETGESKGHNAAFSAADRARFKQELNRLILAARG